MSLLGLSWISSVAVAASVSCPNGVSIDENNVNSKSLQAIVQSKKLSMRQLICCLPKSWRNSYVILPDSRSAQSGTSGRAPRVIIFDPKFKDNLTMALSFVDEDIPVADASAKENMQSGQRYSVEMAEYNAAAGDTRFSDLHFQKDQARKVPGMSEAEIRKHHNGDLKNDPEKKCSLCHDPDSDGRLKTTFPVLPLWSSAFGRVSRMMCLTPEEKAYDQNQRDEFLKVLAKGDTAYSCLVNAKEKLEGTPQNSISLVANRCSNKEPGQCSLSPDLFTFDAMVRNSDDKYFYDRISKTPDFNKYKYSMMASLVGCPMDNLQDYFPLETLASMSQRNGIANNPPLTLNNLPAHIEKANCHGDCSVFDNSLRMPASCANPTEEEFFKEDQADRDKLLRKILADQSGTAIDQARRTYIADTVLKEGRTYSTPFHPNTERMANLRFIFESRGIAIKQMGTASPTGDYSTLVGSTTRTGNLIKWDKDLKGILKTKVQNGVTFVDNKELEDDAACSKLKRASLNAFKKSNSPTAPDTNKEGIQ